MAAPVMTPETENPVNSPELFDSEQPSTSAQGASYIAITPVLPQQKRKRFKAEKGEFNWGTNYSRLQRSSRKSPGCVCNPPVGLEWCRSPKPQSI